MENIKGIGLGIGLALLVGCGPAQDERTSDVKILRGELIKEGQNDARRQSTVALTTDVARSGSTSSLMGQNKSFCSGTVIAKNVIVTAAHCLEKFDPKTRTKQGLMLPKESNYIVSFDTTVNADGRWIAAKKVIPHPDWDPASTLSPVSKAVPNDIGLIILSEDVPDSAKPVKIANANLELPKKTPVYLAGYGVTLKRSKPDTGKLRQVTVKFKSSNSKRKAFSVGKFFRGACAGDSGGPAYVKVGSELQLAGATSTGVEIFGYCIGIHNNYTDVRQYSDWIAKVISENSEEE